MRKTKYVLWNTHADEDGFVWGQLRGKYLDLYLLLSYTITPTPLIHLLNFHFEMLHISAK